MTSLPLYAAVLAAVAVSAIGHVAIGYDMATFTPSAAPLCVAAERPR